jgi:hypothetical protein
MGPAPSTLLSLGHTNQKSILSKKEFSNKYCSCPHHRPNYSFFSPIEQQQYHISSTHTLSLIFKFGKKIYSHFITSKPKLRLLLPIFVFTLAKTTLFLTLSLFTWAQFTTTNTHTDTACISIRSSFQLYLAIVNLLSLPLFHSVFSSHSFISPFFCSFQSSFSFNSNFLRLFTTKRKNYIRADTRGQDRPTIGHRPVSLLANACKTFFEHFYCGSNTRT